MGGYYNVAKLCIQLRKKQHHVVRLLVSNTLMDQYVFHILIKSESSDTLIWMKLLI